MFRLMIRFVSLSNTRFMPMMPISLSVLASRPAHSLPSMVDCKLLPAPPRSVLWSDAVKSYTFSEARQNFAAILEQARRDGAVRIQRRDGQSFVLTPEA